VTRGELLRALTFAVGGAVVMLLFVAAAAFPEQAMGVGTVAVALIALAFEGSRFWRDLRR
jgi:hypothetical protein